MVSEKYTLGELIEHLRESTEFKPKKGERVDAENKKNNSKAVDDIMKQNVSGKKSSKRDTTPENVNDLNRTTLDVKFDYEPAKSYKERVAAQVKGFPSKDNEKNTDAKNNGSLDFKGNENFYKAQSKRSKEMDKISTDIKHSGLAARTMPKETFRGKTIFKEGKTLKRLHFKHTTFLNESEVFEKVPDSYKFDGNKFVMRDSTGTDYIVECSVSEDFGCASLKILNKINKHDINEQLSRMKELSGYSSEEYFKSMNARERVNEDKAVGDLLHTVKSLEEDK